MITRAKDHSADVLDAKADGQSLGNISIGLHMPVQRLAQLELGKRLRLIDPPCELCPGIRSFPLLGHAPGYTYLEIEDAGERLVYVGDMIFDPAALADTQWISPYDCDPAQVRVARAFLLGQSARRRDRFGLCH